MPKVSLSARYATWTNEEAQTKGYFNTTGYVAVDGTTGKRKQALVWFSSPFGPEGGNVLRATLRVKTRQASGTGTHTLIAGLAAKWSLHFKQLTFSTRPGVAGAATTASKTGALEKGTEWSFDVTKQLQAVADGQGMYGFVIHSTTADLVLLEGQMGSGLTPVLDVEWTLAPKPPTRLAPAGGRVVGESRPVLRWDFYDHAGEDNLSSIQVQVSSSSNFTTPSWDSGEVATHWCTLDLPQTSFPAMASGQTVYWRVRNRDTAGLWSGWSSAQSFKYVPRPTVTLQNPSPATPFIVDPTPPIDWTVTGGAQATWRVEIYVKDKQGKWGIQDTSGLRSGTETRWTPTKPLRYRDATYLVVVYITDALDREATPGCTEYVRDSEEVTFKPSASTTSAYSLTAKDYDGSPAVQLAWDQPQQPDRWHIYRDGKLLANYAGSDLLAGAAPHYSITDRWVPAGTHTWQVFAIVNGESWKSASVTRTVTSVGTWLVNTDTQQAVRFISDTEHDMTMPEDVTVHTPLGATHSIAITGGRRGYEGTLSGLLLAGTQTPKGHSARMWRDNLLSFKTDTGQEYRLLIEDLELPVKISNVTLSGVPGVPEAWEASFTWRQVDDFIFDARK